MTLETLLATERELDHQLRHADAEASAILQDARDRAQALESAAADETRQALASLDASERPGIERDIAAARAAAVADAARFDSAADAEIDRLADAVLDDFLGVQPLEAEPAS
jgi:vacuolar-type H+-ATPase subunit H